MARPAARPPTDRPAAPAAATTTGTDRRPSLATIASAWTRIGLTGFGGPPAHIALLRRLVVDRTR